MTSPPLTFAAFIGSLRATSVNRWVFDTVENMTPEITWNRVDLQDVPLYNQDLEDAGAPASVQQLRNAVSAADGLVVFTPEYNWGVPAVTKNAIDWLSRPFGESSLVGKPVGIVAATPGRSGGEQARRHLSESVAVLSDRFFPATLGIPSINHVTEDGVVTNPESLGLLRDWLGGFTSHAQAS